MERLTSWCEEIEEAFLSCEKCKKNGTTECWSQENCTQTAVDRLAEIEDILGNEYDLDRLKQLLDACKGLEPNEIEESKVLIATQKDHEKMARLRELVEADRERRCAILSEPMKPMIYKPNDTDVYCPTCGETLSGGWPLVEWEDRRTMYQCPYCGQSIDTQVCEPYESALKAMKESNNEKDN